ncbi:MAG: PBP1A family penicillin-binding protein [Candidatus Levybacteria bacterium]|nr:PBP1A family penicillin-binding protein [Candidatus Levybacteria bacterium]
MYLIFIFLRFIALFFIIIGNLAILIVKLFVLLALSILHGVRKICALGLHAIVSTTKTTQKALSNLRHRKKVKKEKRRKKIFFHQTTLIKIRYFLIGFIFSFFFIFLPLVFIVFLQDLPHPKELTTRQIPQTTKIYARDGELLYEIYASQNRTLVPLSSIPLSLKNATLAIEDKNFYRHPGFDISSILRALQTNNHAGKILQGGSTITQQLIKSSMLSPEQSIERKVKEIILAFWAERIYTKNEILEMYFNQVPYGGTAWGIEAASEIYFNKHVKNLSLAESAFLAGLTSAPSTYSPFSSTENVWKNRQKEVLSRMVKLSYITQKEADTAAKEKLIFNTQQAAFKAPHFVNYIRDFLVNKYGIAMVEKGGLQVKTTLDLSLNDTVQKIVSEEIAKDGYLNISNGAAVVTNPQNGDILAMIGSKNFNDPTSGNVNLATSLRQPGSSVKIITYSAALENGFTAGSIIDDSPISFNLGTSIYSPVNYDGKYRGKVPLRIALANSLNIPAVKILSQIGVPTMIKLGKDMGIRNWNEPENYGLSLTLGAAEVTMLDMATVNGALANQGKRVDLNPILKITDYKGATLEEKREPSGTQVLTPATSYIISDILSDNKARSMAFGSSSPLVIPGHKVSVKTGTSDNKRDNWTNGYTANFVTIVWVGNNDNTPMSQTLASGITGAAPIWNKIMTQLLSQKKEPTVSPPPDIIAVPCFGRTEYFVRGTESQSSCRTNFPSLTPKTP